MGNDVSKEKKKYINHVVPEQISPDQESFRIVESSLSSFLGFSGFGKVCHGECKGCRSVDWLLQMFSVVAQVGKPTCTFHRHIINDWKELGGICLPGLFLAPSSSSCSEKRQGKVVTG